MFFCRGLSNKVANWRGGLWYAKPLRVAGAADDRVAAFLAEGNDFLSISSPSLFSSLFFLFFFLFFCFFSVLTFFYLFPSFPHFYFFIRW